VESETAAIQFVENVGPHLEVGDLNAVLGVLRDRWPPQSLVALLISPAPEVVRAAVRCLGMTGSMREVGCLARLLGHENQAISGAAEDALWAIWIRSGSPVGREVLERAVRHVKAEEYTAAVELLDELVRGEPGYAEAHHHRAMALCFLGRVEEAADAYERVLKLNPHHYAAAAGLGHTYVERGDALRALELYRLALQVHPGLAEVRDAVKQIEAAVGKREVA